MQLATGMLIPALLAFATTGTLSLKTTSPTYISQSLQDRYRSEQSNEKSVFEKCQTIERYYRSFGFQSLAGPIYYVEDGRVKDFFLVNGTCKIADNGLYNQINTAQDGMGGQWQWVIEGATLCKYETQDKWSQTEKYCMKKSKI